MQPSAIDEPPPIDVLPGEVEQAIRQALGTSLIGVRSALGQLRGQISGSDKPHGQARSDGTSVDRAALLGEIERGVVRIAAVDGGHQASRGKLIHDLRNAIALLRASLAQQDPRRVAVPAGALDILAELADEIGLLSGLVASSGRSALVALVAFDLHAALDSVATNLRLTDPLYFADTGFPLRSLAVARQPGAILGPPNAAGGQVTHEVTHEVMPQATRQVPRQAFVLGIRPLLGSIIRDVARASLTCARPGGSDGIARDVGVHVWAETGDRGVVVNVQIVLGPGSDRQVFSPPEAGVAMALCRMAGGRLLVQPPPLASRTSTMSKSRKSAKSPGSAGIAAADGDAGATDGPDGRATLHWRALLPWPPAAGAALSQTICNDERAPLRGRVLVVLDDSKALALDLAERLRARGASVHTFHEEMSVLVHAVHMKPAPDAYLLDLWLADGRDCARCVSFLAARGTRAVLLTGNPHHPRLASVPPLPVFEKPLTDDAFDLLVAYLADPARLSADPRIRYSA